MNKSNHLEEIEIALNLPKSIKENNLISRDISSLDRILDIYFALKNRNISDENKIINFLFQYIDLNGKDSSLLFRHLDKIKNRDEVIDLIHQKYKNKFDFNLVNSALFESAYETIYLKRIIRYLIIISLILFLSVLFTIYNSKERNSKLNEINSLLLHQNVKLNETNLLLHQQNAKLNESNSLLIQQNSNLLEPTIKKVNELQELNKMLNKYIQKNLLIGSLFYSTRIEDKLPGALKCNGQKVNVDDYPDFVEKYLKTKLVATVSIKEWNMIKESTNNVGFFGYNINESIFIVPFIPSGTFLSSANVGIVNGINMPQGNYSQDQIVNIKGSTVFKMVGINWDPRSSSGALSSYNYHTWSSNIRANGQDDDWNRAHQIDFDASKSVKTGDRVMPRTIYHNLYVIVSNNK